MRADIREAVGMTMRRPLLLAALAVWPLSPLAGEEALKQWRFFGSNDLVVERFDVQGDESAAPYRYEGTFLTNRLGLNIAWTDGIRDFTLRSDISATNSDYVPHEGLLVGSLAVMVEHRGAAIPFRVEAGDVYADFSQRTLQRQVRGASLDFQPQFGHGTHSFVLLAGSGVPDWRTVSRGRWDDLTFSGVSWLWQSASERTTVVTNILHESARAGAAGVFPLLTAGDDHLITSAALRTKISKILLEGEVSVLDAASHEDDGVSFYAELSGNTPRLQWRTRHEDNDRSYVPFSAFGVIAGRSTSEAHARWMISPRASARVALQRSATRTTTGSPEMRADLTQMVVESRPFRRRNALRVQFSADASEFRMERRLQDLDVRNYGLEVQDWVSNLYDLTWRSWLRESKDDLQPLFDRRQVEHEFVAGRKIVLGRWAGRLGGGVAHRRQKGIAPFESVTPVAEISLGNAAHMLRLYYRYTDQQFLSAGAFDVDYHNRQLIYSFTPGNHQFSLEYGDELRRPDQHASTDSQRVALRYRYLFDNEF
jgi:hypothetical protein